MKLRTATAIASMVLVLIAQGCGKKANVSVESAGGNAPPGGPVVIAAGTHFYGKLNEPISTKSSHNGDTFTLTQTDTMLHKDAALHGMVLNGHLDNIQHAGPMKKPGLTIVFDSIQLADGSKAPVSVKLDSVNKFEPRSHHMRTIGMMIGGGIAGHMAAGAHHGGMMGAAGAYALSQTLKTDIVVPAGSVLEVTFTQPVTQGAAPATP